MNGYITLHQRKTTTKAGKLGLTASLTWRMGFMNGKVGGWKNKQIKGLEN
jgi:hypothetical protein